MRYVHACEWACGVGQVKVLYSIPPLFLRPCAASIHSHSGVRADQLSAVAALSSVWPAVCIWLGSNFTSVSPPTPPFLKKIFSHFIHVTVLQSRQLSNGRTRVLNMRLGCSPGGHLQLSNVNPVINSLKVHKMIELYSNTHRSKSQSAKVR